MSAAPPGVVYTSFELNTTPLLFSVPNELPTTMVSRSLIISFSRITFISNVFWFLR